MAERLLELVDSVDRGGSLRLKDIREQYGVDDACARRYCQWVVSKRNLREERRGRVKIWYKPVDQDSRPEAIHEAAVLAFAVSALSELDGTPQYRTLIALADSARRRLLEPALPKFDALTKSFRVRVAHRSRNTTRHAHLATINKAITDRRVCQLKYMKRTGEVVQYAIEPWALVMYLNRLLLVAGKRPAGGGGTARRTFDLDGVQSIEPDLSLPKFSRPGDQDIDIKAIFNDYIGIYSDTGGHLEDVVLRVRGRHAISLQQREVHHSQQHRPLEDGWIEVQLRVVCCEDFKSFVLSMLPDVKVEQPASLRRWIDGVLRQALGG